jgi:hypothetical protein
MERSLEDGLRVKLWKLGEAGGYEIQKVHCFSPRLTLIVSGGQPYAHARRESEELAIVLDAEYEVEGAVLRESLTGKYFTRLEGK